MSDGKEVKRVWISFGEFGNFTERPDWNNDDPTKIAERFLEDKFYTYYSFRKIDAGQEFVSVAEHESIVAELRAEVEALKTTVENNRLEHEWPIVKQLAEAETTIAQQKLVIEKLREQRNAAIKAANQGGLEYGNPKN